MRSVLKSVDVQQDMQLDPYLLGVLSNLNGKPVIDADFLDLVRGWTHHSLELRDVVDMQLFHGARVGHAEGILHDVERPDFGVKGSTGQR